MVPGFTFALLQGLALENILDDGSLPKNRIPRVLEAFRQLSQIILPQVHLPIRKTRKVRLVHPETGRKAEAEVVWRSHEAWDAGFELLKPDATFWNLK